MYWLFGGDWYYPCGGMGDFIGEFTCHVAAELAGYAAQCDWWHVVRSSDRKVMAGGHSDRGRYLPQEKRTAIADDVRRKCQHYSSNFLEEYAGSLLGCGELGDVVVRVDCADPYLIYSKKLQSLLDVNERSPDQGNLARSLAALDAIRNGEVGVSKSKAGEFYELCGQEWQAFVYNRQWAKAKEMLERVGYSSDDE